MYKKVCKICDCAFNGVGPAAKYCPTCQPLAKEKAKKKAALATAAHGAATGRIKNPGVGKGGTTGRGENNHRYKHGGYTHETMRGLIKLERRYCERCSKDLIKASHYLWVMHHRDHDSYNNPEDGSNWELLCKRCHQLEHECHKAFTKGATTIPKGSTLK